VLGERCRRLERKPRVRPLVSRHDEDGHSGIRGRMKPQILPSKDSLLLYEEEGRARRRLILQLSLQKMIVKKSTAGPMVSLVEREETRPLTTAAYRCVKLP
jgi:hypothetical protein